MLVVPSDKYCITSSALAQVRRRSSAACCALQAPIQARVLSCSVTMLSVRLQELGSEVSKGITGANQKHSRVIEHT
jgi:hypothetical protein